MIFLASFNDMVSLHVKLLIFVTKSPSINIWFVVSNCSLALDEISFTNNLHPNVIPKSTKKSYLNAR